MEWMMGPKGKMLNHFPETVSRIKTLITVSKLEHSIVNTVLSPHAACTNTW